MMRELPSRGVVVVARKEREQHFVRRQSDAQVEAEVAIVRHEDVPSALERHRGSRLHGFVPFAGRRKRDLTLTVELKTAVLERPLHQHRTKHPHELLVGQPVAFERGLAHG